MKPPPSENQVSPFSSRPSRSNAENRMVFGCAKAGSSRLKSISCAGSKSMTVPSESTSCLVDQFWRQTAKPQHHRLVGAVPPPSPRDRAEQRDLQAFETGALASVERGDE